MLKRIHKNVKIMLNRMLNLTYGLTLFRLIFITWGVSPDPYRWVTADIASIVLHISAMRAQNATERGTRSKSRVYVEF
jgi:hypothetical protein